MAEVLLSASVEVLLQKLLLIASSANSHLWGSKKELEKLRSSLAMSRAVLHDAERQQRKDQAVKLWLKKLEDLAYDADNLLDELNYTTLKKTTSQSERKVCSGLSLPIPVISCKMRSKIREIIVNLKMVNEEANDFAIPKGVGDGVQCFNHQETDCFHGDSSIVGREEDVSRMVEWLICETNELVVSIFPVVGMGGLGKTTLARLIYNNAQIVRHFDERIWVCVSDTFDANKIFRLIIESLTQRSIDVQSRNALLQILHKELGGRKYLLVLDDVWNEKLEEWDDFKRSLVGINATKGNGVIVTTRSERVASIVATHHLHFLEKLSEDDCWSVFKERAFPEGDVPMELVPIGKEIVHKCSGLPLAASLLGGMLRLTKEASEWSSILRNGLWNLNGDENAVLQVLKLSFDHLPTSVKKCFAYCSIFSRDHDIEKDILVQLWMAEGLLQPSQGDNLKMESLGYEFFNILLQNSLLQDVKRDEYGNITHCKMHNLVHALAQSISRYEGFTAGVSAGDGHPHVRYLSMDSFKESILSVVKDKARSLRTLFFADNISSSMLSNFKYLRVLSLRAVDIVEVPASISKLIHLRYLDLSGTKVRALPDSICMLLSLQTLRLNGCDFLERLPNHLSKLNHLRHLHYYSFDTTCPMPSKMGQLTCLQTLQFFNVECADGRQISEIGFLKELGGELEIRNLEKVNNQQEARRADLYRKEDVYKLIFQWRSGRQGPINDDFVLAGLEPHPNLKSLTVENFMGDNLPTWIMTMMVSTVEGHSLGLDNLVEIKLKGCTKCEELPMLGHLLHLKYLDLSGMDNLKKISHSFYGGNFLRSRVFQGDNTNIASFRVLQRLILCDMANLVEWIGPEEVTIEHEHVKVFPQLEEIEIQNCSQLTTTPCSFPNLEELRISNVSSYQPLQNVCSGSNSSSLTFLHIDGLLELACLPDNLLYNVKNLVYLAIHNCPNLKHVVPHVRGFGAFLRVLDIKECINLSTLPDDLQTLKSLAMLWISKCPKVISIPSLAGLKTLEELRISYCDELASLPNEMLLSCKSLKSLSVENCANLTSFPTLQQLSSLLSLRLVDCPQLTCLPKGLHSLSCLNYLRIGPFSEDLTSFPILDYDDTTNSEIHEVNLQLCSLRCLTLFGRPHWDSLPAWLQNLTSLAELHLYDFGFEAVPEWIKCLSSLERLGLYWCEKLSFLPSHEAIKCLTKLKEMEIYNCPLLRERCTSLTDSNSEWSKISHISQIRIDGKLTSEASYEVLPSPALIKKKRRKSREEVKKVKNNS